MKLTHRCLLTPKYVMKTDQLTPMFTGELEN